MNEMELQKVNLCLFCMEYKENYPPVKTMGEDGTVLNICLICKEISRTEHICKQYKEFLLEWFESDKPLKDCLSAYYEEFVGCDVCDGRENYRITTPQKDGSSSIKKFCKTCEHWYKENLQLKQDMGHLRYELHSIKASVSGIQRGNYRLEK